MSRKQQPKHETQQLNHRMFQVLLIATAPQPRFNIFPDKFQKMKNQLFVSLSTALFIFLSCGTVHTTTPSRIGLLPLNDYQLTSAPLQSDTSYQVIRSDEAFRGRFSSTAAARVPDFNGQMVVAIVFKNPVTTPLQFEKAEVTGSTINVYAVTCTKANCSQGQALLATIPKVGNAATVQFVINGVNKQRVTL